jgi:DNA mismatch endonuclease (patch repair protein)
MQAVRSTNTKPELAVRQLAYHLGYRYQLHRKDLPGKPDLAFIGRHRVVFVHGCFWHGHECARGSRAPKTNADYWGAKIARNRARDVSNVEKLERDDWRVLIIWECELKQLSQVKTRLSRFLAARATVDRKDGARGGKKK